ncbi:hypothetical protein C6501_10925, partial [Candidatus Poribacteria bacterium]
DGDTDLGWISKVEDNKVTLQPVEGKEIAHETEYVIKGKVSDAAGNETEVSITFTTADVTDPEVTGGTVKDGDKDVDPAEINEDGIEITFSEDVLGDIALHDGDTDLGWISKVEDNKVTLQPVEGKEIAHETEYVIKGSVSDAAGNETEVNITFTTKMSDDLNVEPKGKQLVALGYIKHNLLLQNYPNPFNPETWIPYQLAHPADVRISIYAADGKLVRSLLVGSQPAGMYQSRSRAAHWDGRNALGEPVASGVYFYTLKADKFSATRKMLIRK